MRAEEVHGLMEAYSKVYEAPEVLNEEVVEEDVEQLMERGAPTDPKARAAYDAQVSKNRAALGNTLLYGNPAGRKPEAPSTRNRNVRGGGVIKAGATAPAAKPAATPAAKPAATPAAKPAATPAAKPAATPAAKPAATPAAKPAATAAPKPSTPAAPAKPAEKPSAMDQWAKANPKLAQAQKIRQQGGSRAEVNKVLYNKGTAPATSTPTVVKAGVDIFDLVKGYLLDEGYAESEDAAMVIMVNMSAEWKESILESYGVQLDELSDRTVGSAVNARIAATGAAIDRENKNRTPQNVRDTERAADKESSIKRAAARRRKRMQANEDYVDEGRRTSLSALSGESQKRKEDEERGRPESEDEKHKRLRLGRYSPSQYKYEKDEKGNWKNMGRKDGEED